MKFFNQPVESRRVIVAVSMLLAAGCSGPSSDPGDKARSRSSIDGKIEEQVEYITEKSSFYESWKFGLLAKSADRSFEYDCRVDNEISDRYAGERRSDSQPCIEKVRSGYLERLEDLRQVEKKRVRRKAGIGSHQVTRTKSVSIRQRASSFPRGFKDTEERMAVEYVTLKYMLSPDLRALFVKSQAGWNEYRRRYCNFKRRMMDGRGWFNEILAFGSVKDCYHDFAGDRLNWIFMQKARVTSKETNHDSDLINLILSIEGGSSGHGSAVPDPAVIYRLAADMVKDVNEQLDYKKFPLPEEPDKLKPVVMERIKDPVSLLQGGYYITGQAKSPGIGLIDSIALLDGSIRVRSASGSIVISTETIEAHSIESSVLIAKKYLKPGNRYFYNGRVAAFSIELDPPKEGSDRMRLINYGMPDR